MGKLSIIIPARDEQFLPQTVNDLLAKATGEVEVIAVLDGYWPDPYLVDDKRLHVIHRSASLGMRAAINAAAAIARGEWLMKCDAHCMFQEGYDRILQADCDKNWIVIPARYSLDPLNWCIDNNGKPRRDYHYLCFPDPNKEHDSGMHGVEWWERGRERSDKVFDIDDNMSFQGSCWFMHRDWFWKFLGGMNEYGYGSFTQEPQEIGNKTWLGGGAIKVNKKCWYAHLHKGKQFRRGYNLNKQEIVDGHAYSAWLWATDSWSKRAHDLEWLIDRFWPVPSWPDDWQKQINDYWPAYGKQRGLREPE